MRCLPPNNGVAGERYQEDLFIYIRQVPYGRYKCPKRKPAILGVKRIQRYYSLYSRISGKISKDAASIARLGYCAGCFSWEVQNCNAVVKTGAGGSRLAGTVLPQVHSLAVAPGREAGGLQRANRSHGHDQDSNNGLDRPVITSSHLPPISYYNQPGCSLPDARRLVLDTSMSNFQNP